MHDAITKLSETYGGIFTIFFGPKPTVVITDLELAKQAFKDKKADFNGRPHFPISHLYLGSEGQSVPLSNYTRTWEVLRRVVHSATRKYAISESFNQLVARVVDETLAVIKEREGEKFFNPSEHVFLIVGSIFARSVYGAR